MKTVFWLCAACIVFTMNICPGQAQETSNTAIERLKRSVVPIVCVGQRLDTTIYLISVEGTGFFLSGDGDVVTAGHVAKGIFANRLPVCAIQAIYVPMSGWDVSKPDFPLKVIPIRQCWWNDDSDLGVCALAANPFSLDEIIIKPLIAELDGTVLADGKPIIFTGFPLSFLQPITSQGTVGTYRSILGDKLGPREIVVDKNAWPGASGSPVYGIDGTVHGLIVQRGFNDASGLAFGRTSPYIKQFLADNKAQREKEAQQPNQLPSVPPK